MPTECSDDATEIARKVLLILNRHDIPVTPENYQVWFEHMTGSNLELSKEIDACLAEGTRFDDARNRMLYEKHFGKTRESKFVQEISQATLRILKEALVATGRVTQNYSKRLNVFANRLETDELNPAALKEIIEALILDTRKVEESSSDLCQQLDKHNQEVDELRQRLGEAEREASHDTLTDLYNRRYFDKAIQALHAQYRQGGEPFSVMRMDIDHFEHFDDKYGEKVGDSVLEFVGLTIAWSMKTSDVPARYRGGKFIALLPATSSEDAYKLAESIRKEISSKTLRVTKTQECIGTVTVSCGVAQINDDDTVDSVLDRADQALFLAKGSGRNRVMSETDLPA